LEIDDLVEIGTIVGVLGLKGEVKVRQTTDFPERFTKAGERWLRVKGALLPQKVELVKGRVVPGKDVYVVKLAQINDRTQAEALKGGILYVDKCDRPPLEKDEYHVSDLIGLEVYNQQNRENIGIIKDVFSAGNDILEVKLHQQPEITDKKKQTNLENITRVSKRKKFRPKQVKEKTVLIPFVQEIVPVVDLNKKIIEINPPLGLLDDNQAEESQ